MLETTAPGGEILISLDGPFDAFVAWQLRGRLSSLPPSAYVVLDFSEVNEFFDLGVAVMAHGLSEGDHPHVRMRGLREHEYRLFRYFGVDLSALGSGVRGVAAP